MTLTQTYKELYNLDRDIRTQSNYSPAFALFNAEKIKRFYQQNNLRLKIMMDRISELMELHINKDEKGSYKQVIAPEGQPNHWDYKSDEDGEKFKKSFDELMSKNIDIHN